MAGSRAQGWGWGLRACCWRCGHLQRCLKRWVSETTFPLVLAILSPKPVTALGSTMSLSFPGKYSFRLRNVVTFKYVQGE